MREGHVLHGRAHGARLPRGRAARLQRGPHRRQPQPEPSLHLPPDDGGPGGAGNRGRLRLAAGCARRSQGGRSVLSHSRPAAAELGRAISRRARRHDLERGLPRRRLDPYQQPRGRAARGWPAVGLGVSPDLGDHAGDHGSISHCPRAGEWPMDFDPVLLARLQFAFTVTFHIIFPSFTIGLSAFIATLLVRWIMTGREHLHRLARFWTKIFAVSFGMGVVSGIVLSYEFGTNWSRFSVVVGYVVGPLIGYEVLTAFFLEATFLGVMLFGWRRVPPWLHVLSAVAVAGGTAISAFWILSANSWMQTPAGYELRGGIAYPLDWLAVIFNPSFVYRLAHMLTAAYLTTSLVVLAVGARYLLAGKYPDEARTMMRMAIGMLAALGPLQLLIGDSHGLNTLEHQPIKIAAIEAHWDGSKPGALVLFAWPDAKSETNRLEIAIPRAGSLILTHDPDGLFPGLTSVAPADRPPIVPVFFAFRAMDGIGVVIIAAGLRRGDLGVDRHRDRTPAVARPRDTAHRRCDLAGSERERRGDARFVRVGLRHRVRDGHLLHQPADRQGTGRARDRAPRARHADAAVVLGARSRTRSPGAATVRRGEESRHGMVPAGDLGRAPRRRSRVLRHPRRLRSRRRHPVSLCPQRAGARPDDGLGGAVLGRQRDLARSRRRRPVGRLPASLCGDHAGALPAGDRHAARPGVSRRRLRISLGRSHQQEILESGVRRRLDARRLLPGPGARRSHSRHQGGERRLRRRSLRLGDAVRVAVRPRRRRRLRPARRNLAGDEDGGRRRRARPSTGRGVAGRGAGIHGRGQHLDPAGVRAHRRALVLGPEHLFPVAGAVAHRLHCAPCLALPRGGARGAAFPRLDRPVPARLSRPGDLHLSLSGPAHADDLADRSRSREPDFPVARHGRAAADHPRLLRVRVLAVPRQGARGRRIPLRRGSRTECASFARNRPAYGFDPPAVAAGCACGLITPQPMRNSGRRPCTPRSKARGTSGTRSGKRSLISAGGVPAVSAVGQTTIAPLLLTASGVTQGERSGVALRKRLGRLGAPSAISAAVRVSPVTICSGAPVRRSKLSEKKRAIASAGCSTLRSTLSQGRIVNAAPAMIGGMIRRPNQAAMTTFWRLNRMPSPAATTTSSPERMTSGAIPPTGPDQPMRTATRVPAKAGTTAKK